jgi:hypothetical protein
MPLFRTTTYGNFCSYLVSQSTETETFFVAYFILTIPRWKPYMFLSRKAYPLLKTERVGVLVLFFQ